MHPKSAAQLSRLAAITCYLRHVPKATTGRLFRFPSNLHPRLTNLAWSSLSSLPSFLISPDPRLSHTALTRPLLRRAILCTKLCKASCNRCCLHMTCLVPIMFGTLLFVLHLRFTH